MQGVPTPEYHDKRAVFRGAQECEHLPPGDQPVTLRPVLFEPAAGAGQGVGGHYGTAANRTGERENQGMLLR